jgi:nitrate/nitrite transporter NarK
MLPFLGDVGGSFLGGLISDWALQRTGSERFARQTLSALAMAGCGVLVWVAGRVDQAQVAVVVISAGMFCAGVGNPCMSAAAMRFGGEHVATLSGVTNMCGNFGAAAFPMAVPYLLSHWGGWNTVLALFSGLYVVACVAWLAVGDVRSSRR